MGSINDSLNTFKTNVTRDEMAANQENQAAAGKIIQTWNNRPVNNATAPVTSMVTDLQAAKFAQIQQDIQNAMIVTNNGANSENVDVTTFLK